jgi:glycosyltransferase involved in cell wall biosynthesis
MTAPLRVAVIADYAEEEWPSMDLVADMLMSHLAAEHRGRVEATLIRPRMPRRFGRMAAAAGAFDRVLARVVDYPRALKPLRGRFDVYHIVDHSYAHLVHELPAERTVVTCHDLDAFRAVLEPGAEPRSFLYRALARRILSGLCRAARVACVSEATRNALVALAGVPEAKLSVIPNGTDAGHYPEGNAAADVEAARLLGPRRGVELLHVGSTIPRKRIDLLLAVFAGVLRGRPGARLTRVGGPFTAEQRVQARTLGVTEAITVLPFVDRATLGAVYRRSALALLTSDREGFGLPIVEALASGTPMIVSDIPVLREVGGEALTYRPIGDIDAWVEAILTLLEERDRETAAWERRRETGRRRAAEFSWSHYTASVVELYGQLGEGERAQQAGPASGMRPEASAIERGAESERRSRHGS